MPRLETALITGGTGAVGRHVASRFLADGFRVATTYRVPEEWDSMAAAHADAVAAGRLIPLEADVTDHDAMGDAVRRSIAALGGLRVLIHVAGGYRGGVTVDAVDEKTVRLMIDLNLVSAFWAAKHSIPAIRESGAGRLLFFSSRGAVETYPGAAAYAASKAGLHALVGTLAKELKATGATANAILPSVIDTEANRAAMPDAARDAWVRPEQVASLLAFLASDAAAAVSGALIPIYGRA
ncbi:MAG TPA: SDR family NAD(P)-dependent oxidoreductase [Candidatus Eisenbacteria bacterium]